MRTLDVRRDLRRVTLGLLLCFLIVALAAAFWGVLRAGSLVAREDNARNVIREQQIKRGAIFAHDGERLAYSVADRNGVMQRVYPDPAVTGAVGYYSFTYGTAGLEAAYNDVLRGDEAKSGLRRVLDRALHRPQQGGDIRTTIDLQVQQAVSAALGERSGAVVVVDVPSGRVLGMVSTPGYDPNTLDAQWDTLTQGDSGPLVGGGSSPLLNRVTSGLYQPGGALQPVILAAVLGTYPELARSGAEVLNVELPGARDVIRVGSLALECLEQAPQTVPLTLAEAFVHGCPAPFARAFEGPLAPAKLWDRFNAFGLLQPPALTGFDTVAARDVPPLNESTPLPRLTAALTGQGALTVTPLHMLQIVAAVANRGNGVPLHLVDAVRPPDAKDWQPVDRSAERPALMRADVAAAVRLAMLQAAARSSYVRQAQVTQGPGSDRPLYGSVALAYSGPDETPYAWFQGFVDLTEGDQPHAVAVVVVIENESDPGAAAQVARAAFDTALDAIAGTEAEE